MTKKLVTLLAAAALTASLTIPAIAVSRSPAAGVEPADPDGVFVESPSGKQEVETDNEEIEIVTDNVVTGGFIQPKGKAEPRPLEEIDYPVVKITTLAMSQSANAKVDASNPEATGGQKSGIMTESGLPYGENDQVNQTAERYYAADTTSEFVEGYDLAFFDHLVALSQGNLEHYAVVQIADISANSLALSTSQSVRLTFSAPGIKTSSRVMVARIWNGAMEFIPSTAGNGTISFSIYPSSTGTYLLLTRVD